ncbi:MAG: hypothetical protein WAL71_01490 [Terriglobales bacterium]|jgi:hypothetical protein
MTNIKTMAVLISLAGLSSLAFAETPAPKRVSPTEAKGHIGETAIVCGKVVDSRVPRNGLGGYGIPVSFDLDQPEPNPVFYFVTFAPGPPDTPQKTLDAYNGKQVCITGKIGTQPGGNGTPFIFASDRAQIKIDAPASKDAAK